MLDLSDLYAFVRIADIGSISGAARSLGSPKSSVSRSLMRLEGSVGAPLMERSTRHLRLTDGGLLMLRHARRILDDVGDAENAMGGLISVPSGTLRVSVPFTFADGILAARLPAFLKRYPDVRVVLTIDNRLIDLQAEEIDVAIRIGPLADSDLVARKIASFELWPCASPVYLAEHGTPRTAQDLLKHRVLAHSDRRSVWQFKTQSGAVERVEITPTTVVPEPSIAKTMVILGAGIAQLPDFQAAEEVGDGRLVRLLPQHQPDTVDAHALYTSRRSLSAKVRVFINALTVQTVDAA